MTSDAFMQRALELAAMAAKLGEVPVGAVLVKDGRIIGEGYNTPIARHDPTAHAEIQALRHAAQVSENYRLPGTTLYVTLEPCAMCAGAIVHARVEKVVFAAPEPRAGAVISTQHFFESQWLNHHVQFENGLLADASSMLLKQFFAKRRGARVNVTRDNP